MTRLRHNLYAAAFMLARLFRRCSALQCTVAESGSRRRRRRWQRPQLHLSVTRSAIARIADAACLTKSIAGRPSSIVPVASPPPFHSISWGSPLSRFPLHLSLSLPVARTPRERVRQAGSNMQPFMLQSVIRRSIDGRLTGCRRIRRLSQLLRLRAERERKKKVETGWEATLERTGRCSGERERREAKKDFKVLALSPSFSLILSYN